MKKYLNISDLKFEDDVLNVTIDVKMRRNNLKEIFFVFDKASIEERNNFEVSPSDYGCIGLHWMKIFLLMVYLESNMLLNRRKRLHKSQDRTGTTGRVFR